MVCDYNVTTGHQLVGGAPRSDWTSTYGFDAHSVVSTPSALFVNASGNDYHLSATSPALDIGTANSAPTADIAGNPRPSGSGFDIGAYERQVTSVSPSPPTNLAATGGIGSISLAWTAGANDNSYKIYRSTTSGFTPNAGNLLGTSTTTSYLDTNCAANTTYYYLVTGVNGAQESGPSNQASATDDADTTPPTVSITAPANNATVAGTITFSASASDNVQVAYVQFLVDGSQVGTNQTASPYSVSVDTTTYVDGSHTLGARAVDGAGNQTTTSITVTIHNNAQPPSNLTATGAVGSITLGWTAGANDASYRVYRSTVSGFTPSASTLLGSATSTSYVDTHFTGGTTYYYLVTGMKNSQESGPSNQASAVGQADTTPPTVSFSAPSNGATVSGTITVSANATDNVGVAGVQFAVDGTSLGAQDTTAPYSVSWNTTTVANGSHTLTATATDLWGNQAVSTITVTVNNQATTSLVAAYNFNEGSGTVVHDLSGNGNNGTISNATWTTNGKYGGALSFNGSNAWVTIPDSTSLRLTNGMTLEAWVNPSRLSNWRSVILKERGTSGLSYSLYATDPNQNPSAPATFINTGGSDQSSYASSALSTNTWTHIAGTYDGSRLRIYVNGTLIRTVSVSGNIRETANPLRIGGNSVWGEYFSGVIDQVQIYNTARTQAQIQTDMNTALAPSQATSTTPAVVTAASSGSLAAPVVNVFFQSPTTATSSGLVVTSAGNAGANQASQHPANTQTGKSWNVHTGRPATMNSGVLDMLYSHLAGHGQKGGPTASALKFGQPTEGSDFWLA